MSIVATGCHNGLLVPQDLGLSYVKRGRDELQPAYLANDTQVSAPADYIARPDAVVYTVICSSLSQLAAIPRNRHAIPARA